MALITLPRQLTVDINGEPRVGARLSVYNAGTNDTRVVYTTKAFAVELIQPIESVEGGIFPAIYVNPSGGDFKLVIADADGAPIYTEDNIPSQLGATDIDLAGLATESVGTPILSSQKRTQAEIDAEVIPTDYSVSSHEVCGEFYPTRYGLTANGLTDDGPAIARAISVAVAAGGGTIRLPQGSILIQSAASSDSYANGIVVPYASPINSLTKNIRIVGAGRSTVLKCGSNNMVLLRMSASNSGVENLTLDNNSKTGCCALGVIAENMTQTTDYVHQNYNAFNNLWIEGTFLEGIHMKAGPDVGGGDSGCWYNKFDTIHVRQATRGLFLDEPNNAGGSPVNGNTFLNMRFGETGMNTGIYILSGGGNHFLGIGCEGIQSGTSPSATPTAIVIKGNAGATEMNRFFGVRFEANTRDVENENSRTDFDLANIGPALYTAVPNTIVGGYDPSLTPLVLPGLLHQGNGQIGTYENNVMHVTAASGLYVQSLLRTKAQTATSSSGGSASSFDTPSAYAAGAMFLMIRGAYDSAGTSYSHRASIICETSSGTFVESGSRIIDLQTAGVTVTTDNVARVSASLRFTVHIAKAATVFTNYATLIRLT